MRARIAMRLVVMLGGAAGCGQNQNPTPVPQPQKDLSSGTEARREGDLWTEWIYLDTPESALALGQAFAFGDGVQNGCYSVAGNGSQGVSYAKVRIDWNSETKAGLKANLSKLIGLGAAVDHTTKGYVEFDSVYVAHAVNLQPDVANCVALGADLLPLKPAIVGLIGARSYTYSLTSTNDVDVYAQAEGEIKSRFAEGKVTFGKGAGGSRLVTLTEPHWFGVQLQGFELGQPHVLEWADIKPLGTISNLSRLQYTVTASEDDTSGGVRKFRVQMRSVLGGQSEDFLVQDGEVFQFGPKGLGGAYLLATFFVGGVGESQYQIRVDRRAHIPVRFTRPEGREAVVGWVTQRVNALAGG